MIKILVLERVGAKSERGLGCPMYYSYIDLHVARLGDVHTLHICTCTVPGWVESECTNSI